MKGDFRKGGWKGKNSSKQPHSKQVQVTFFLIDQKKIGIEIPFGSCTKSVKNIIRQHGNGIWNYDDKCWVVLRQQYEEVLQKIENHFYQLNNQQAKQDKIIKVNPIEKFVFQAEQLLKRQLKEIKITNLEPYSGIVLKYNPIETNIDPQSLPFYKKLFDFQKDSLKFGIKHHGRMLLADEMGVGKTIQSLAIAYIYKHEWPLLIICPPTLKFNWLNEIKRWYSDVQLSQVQMINHAKTPLKVNVKIMIISYDLATKLKQIFQHVRIVIADEAHYLKSTGTKRSNNLVPYLSTRKRVILLTGTPAFARPKQIYNLITIVRPQLFKNFKSFGNRYCEPKWNHWARCYDYNGCKNVKQLHYILKDNIMIRRLKVDVLTELPDKNRQKITLQTDSTSVKDIKKILQKNDINKMQTFFSEFINTATSSQQQSIDKRQQIMEAYRLSGMAKIKAVKQYIDEILQNNTKILVFAHHIKVMDEIEGQLKNKNHKFMRIDGSVSQQQRAQNVQKFQKDPEILVALLSITAAGVGITLTAASTVIFAELHWTPALMIQAEDRAHRVGQKNSVNCHYLIGQNTLDEMLYKFLQKKVLNVSSFIDGQRKDLNFEQCQKGMKGKVSKKEEIPPSHKFNFGNNLLHPVGNRVSTPQDQDTDISSSTDKDKKKQSRKKLPSSTLDNFVVKNKIIQQRSEQSQLKNSNHKTEQDTSKQQDDGTDSINSSEKKKSPNFKKLKPVTNQNDDDDDSGLLELLEIYQKQKKLSQMSQQNHQQEKFEYKSTQSIKKPKSEPRNLETGKNKNYEDESDDQFFV